ncbi:glycosyltransferase family 1 protein [Flavobacterium sp.]|jgi:glycosyltransferase involved in cell wall biosynthesis|uniref:glycosyltransferase family 4 protein n=1 Tax=Flavobacterium sp. TaxID=239 RepID=UPI002C123F8A|nr:glycosyltransferase family 1 protein [Flavobacterium sp.]HQA73966.1 glycosyltransferase family 1 protein [Flavobacterium sp.]
MNIGFDAKRFFHNRTGLGNYSRDLIRILAHYFPNNKYVLYNPKPKKIDSIVIDGTTIVEKLPFKKIEKKLSSLWRIYNVVFQIKEDNINIYHGLSGEIPIGLHKTSTKTVVTIHDLIFIRYPEMYSFFDRKIHLKKFQYAANNSDLIIAISEQTKRDIVDFLKINPDKIRVVYQGCAPIFKEEIGTKLLDSVVEKYNLPSKFLLNVGTIEKRKNVLLAIKAIKDIDIKLVIIGKKTNYYNEITTYIQDTTIEDKIIFLENVSLNELAAIYRLATIFIYPSIFEGFGIPIIEALYSKTPVITSTGSCFSEAGGKDSMYVDCNDTEALKSGIEAILFDEAKQETMKRNGFEFVQKFNDDVIARELMKVYDEVLS